MMPACAAPVVERRLVTLADWYGLAAEKLTIAAGEYRAISREIASGRVAGVFVDGRPLFIGAVSPVGAGSSSVAWCFVAAGGIGGFSIAVVRGVRRHFEAVAPFHCRVVAVVSDGNVMGQRLASLVGMVPREAVALGFRIWELNHG